MCVRAGVGVVGMKGPVRRERRGERNWPETACPTEHRSKRPLPLPRRSLLLLGERSHKSSEHEQVARLIFTLRLGAGEEGVARTTKRVLQKPQSKSSSALLKVILHG